jgi:hypothetical protein
MGDQTFNWNLKELELSLSFLSFALWYIGSLNAHANGDDSPLNYPSDPARLEAMRVMACAADQRTVMAELQHTFRFNPTTELQWAAEKANNAIWKECLTRAVIMGCRSMAYSVATASGYNAMPVDVTDDGLALGRAIDNVPPNAVIAAASVWLDQTFGKSLSRQLFSVERIEGGAPEPLPYLKRVSPPSTAVEPFQIEVVAQRMSALVDGLRWTGNQDPLDAERWGMGRVVGYMMLDGSEARCALTELQAVSGRVIMLSARLFPCSEEYLLDQCFHDIFSRFNWRTGSKHLFVSWLGRPTFATFCCDAEEGALGFTDEKLLLSHELTSRLAPFFRDSLSSLNVIRQREGCNSAESQHAYSMFSKSLDSLLDTMPLELHGRTLSE